MSASSSFQPLSYLEALKDVLPIAVGAVTLLLLFRYDEMWLVAIELPLLAAILFAWIFATMLWVAFRAVHHADAIARSLREPFGTLVLTFAVIIIEVSLIAAIMLTGDAAPTLARDAMLAVLMIVLNGLVGGALLIGGIVHQEQDYNLRGARAFVSVLIPLAVFALVLPAFTVSTRAPTFAPEQALLFALLTALLYAVFLAIQTGRHKSFFLQEVEGRREQDAVAEARSRGGRLRAIYHLGFLAVTLLPIVLLSRRMAKLVDVGTAKFGVPTALGGIVVAFLVLAPEGIAAMKAAYANHLQRSVNLLLGAALSTIGLTVPAVLVIGLWTGQAVTLGLDEAQMVLLLLTLLLSAITFGSVRTNLLQGAVHLVVFLAYIVLVFNP